MPRFSKRSCCRKATGRGCLGDVVWHAIGTHSCFGQPSTIRKLKDAASMAWGASFAVGMDAVVGLWAECRCNVDSIWILIWPDAARLPTFAVMGRRSSDGRQYEIARHH